MAKDKERDEEDEEASDEEDDRERKEDYLGFKRKMDEFKGATKGMISESESLKKQGNAYFTFGCYTQATMMYSDAIQLQPHHHVLYCNRAMAYLKQDMPELALKDAEMSLGIERSAENIKAYWRKAQALLDLGRFQEAEDAATEGIEIQPRNQHLNKVRKKAREATVVLRLTAGEWVGKMENGIEQRLAYSKSGEMSMTVFTHSLTATYELSVEGSPWSMVVKMKQQIGPGSPPPAPPMVYIFEFHENDEELWLCHPVGTKDLPEKFEGPGLVKCRRVPFAAPESGAATDEPLEQRCARYMREMNEVMPLMPPQLPEKPSDEQIKEEVELCGRVSGLKRHYGFEVHERAVDLARAPSSADDEELQKLAEQFRRRLLARKLLSEDEAPKGSPKVVEPEPQSQAPPPAAEDVPASAEVAKGDRRSVADFLRPLVASVCGGCGKSS